MLDIYQFVKESILDDDTEIVNKSMQSLDIDCDSLEDLKDALEHYYKDALKKSSKISTTPKIINGQMRGVFKTHNKNEIQLDKHFIINISLNGNDVKLIVGTADGRVDEVILQAIIKHNTKSLYSWATDICPFKLGGNFYEYLVGLRDKTIPHSGGRNYSRLLEIFFN